ncbi:MAG: hypothetical protein K2G85_09230 [Muribaculaceae bacterium]|nr:hypothetical protein [Muribaculaceae bacterium]
MKKILMTLTLAMAAMIAIPTAANAQDTNVEVKKECCKEKQECKKETCKNVSCKECKNECKNCTGKPCLKDGKKRKMKRAHSGKMMRGSDRKMMAPKDARMHKEMRKDGVNPLFNGITLTEEQKAKMKALRENNMADREKSKADRKAKDKEEIQKRRAAFDKEIEKILDKDQLKQYKANKAEMEAKRADKAKKSDK